MDFKIETGLLGHEEQIVIYEDTAAKYGSGLVEVFATPAMIAMMEKTCLNSVLTYLPDGMGTVGTKVEIVHTKATPIGMKVFCDSKLIEVDRRRLVFEVISRDEQGEIGRGKHERFIIDVAKFMNSL